MKSIGTSTQIFGLSLFSSTQDRLLSVLKEKLLGSSRLITIATPNPEQIIQSDQNRKFRDALSNFEILLPDGMGLVWASRVLLEGKQGRSLAERITGADVVVELLKIARQHGLSVLILGGKEYDSTDTASGEAQQLQALYPNLDLPECWWLPGYQDITKPSQAEEHIVTATIERLKPAIVFVAFGAPAQELWIQSHRVVLEKAQVTIAMAVGGAFDYALGKVARAPRVMQALGLEWTFRLMTQPWRWRRQLRLVQFIGKVLKVRLLG